MRLGWRNGKDQGPNEIESRPRQPMPRVSAAPPHAKDSSPPPQSQHPQPQTVKMSEDSARRVVASRKSAAVLGDVVSLLARSPRHKHHSLADLEWLILPALATGQFQMAEGIDQATGARGPVALVAWAKVSDDIEQRLRTTAGQPHRLSPHEWASGTNAWLMLAAGDPRVLQGLFGNVAAAQFKDQPLWLEQRDPNGTTVVTTLRDLVRANTAPASQVGMQN